MPQDFNGQAEFLHQLAFDGRIDILSWLNPSSWKTNKPRSPNKLRTSDHQEVSVFVENSNHCMASLVSGSS
jgi:hypothetical protein